MTRQTTYILLKNAITQIGIVRHENELWLPKGVDDSLSIAQDEIRKAMRELGIDDPRTIFPKGVSL